MNRLERLTNLLALLLNTKSPLTLKQIVDEVKGYPDYDSSFDACRRTFERDKSFLRAQGINLKTLRIHSSSEIGYLIDKEDYYMKLTDLSVEERTLLYLIYQAIGETLPSAFKSTDSFLNNPDPNTFPSFFLGAPGIIDDLINMLNKNNKIRFLYKDRERIVSPVRICLKRSGWFLEAVEEAGKEAPGILKSFRIDRIKLPSLTKFKALKTSHELGSKNDEEIATIWVDPIAAKTLYHMRKGFHSFKSHKDGSATIQIKISYLPGFYSWLVKLGRHAKLIKPEHIREKFLDWLKEF